MNSSTVSVAGRTVVVLLAAFFSPLMGADVEADSTETVYLSGQGSEDPVLWDFYCTGGRRSGTWSKIPVPSNWEFHGFGAYNYGLDKQKADEKGRYRHRFQVPSSWKGKRVRLVFDGVMTDTEVWVNGKSAGPVHQGGFYRFKYDVTQLVKMGEENLLEVTVSKRSSNETVELAERKADYWIFGGIYRPVYLEALPAQFIDWTAIDARSDGSLRAVVHLKHVSSARELVAQLRSTDGEKVGAPFKLSIGAGQEEATLSTQVEACETWSAETPNLYLVDFTLMGEGGPLHTVTERFGFRTFEVRRGEGLFLNGKRIQLKGVNRHSFWPPSGRSLSQRLCREDARLIKEMNANAVRMSHYPPDTWFLDACDELGLYVLDELGGWHKPAYDTQVGRKLVREMVIRDVNHPCVIFWDNGNEGGFNTELDGDFALHDPQQRPVLHPWATFSGVNAQHYAFYDALREGCASKDLIFMPTELLHGLFDGGHGAGLEDYWSVMKNSRCGGGLFLWVFADSGAVRTDLNGLVDVDRYHAPDGIVGPYREKEGSFFAIKEIWSPLGVTMKEIPEGFDGSIEVVNEYHFTDLARCRFEWELVDFSRPHAAPPAPHVMQGGSIAPPSCAPGGKARIRLELPPEWRSRDALYLRALDPHGSELWTWTWPIKTHGEYRKAILPPASGKVNAMEHTDSWRISTGGGLRVRFDKATGMLVSVEQEGRSVSLSGGPRLVASQPPDSPQDGSPDLVVRHRHEDGCHIVEAENSQSLEYFRWRLEPSGVLELKYRYRLGGKQEYFGIGFDYPEAYLRAKTWLGDGPYRVWKNRGRGARFGLWHTAYNNTVPGRSWEYPEFKGYFANLHWARFHTAEGAVLVATDTPDLFLRVYTPENGLNPRTATAPFPDGDISFLHAVPAIGTKFNHATKLGPQGQLTEAGGLYEGTLYFSFETAP